MTAINVTAGDEIESNCLKCKALTNHIVIALTDDVIAKVQCNVCGGRHKYRPTKPAKTPKSSTLTRKSGQKISTRISTAALNKNAANFDKLLTGKKLDRAIPYSMTTAFGKNDIVDHPTFGQGVVTSTIQPNKIELTFKEGPKILICVLQ